MGIVTYEKRLCEYDKCCEFEPASWNQMYCPECHCKRKAENERKRVNETASFEQPRRFIDLRIPKVKDGYKVMIVNDLHIPFQDIKTMFAVEKFWADFQPDLEIYPGDITDFYSISTFDKNPSRRFKFQDEIDMSHEWLFNRCEANPNARRIFIDGNHEDRIRRWLWKYGEDISGLRALEFDNLLGLKELGIERLPYMSVVDFLGYRIEHGSKTSQSKAFPINVSRYMAISTGSSGLCGHTHRFSTYAWTDASGSHSYIENGCLCRFNLEFAPFPNWQQAFTFGIVKNNKIHIFPTQLYSDGFIANGEWYPRK